jgi:2-polyprenyl-3-methyl-5-hydroxy-6-metoxy-1,4-benzoquinol methylase
LLKIDLWNVKFAETETAFFINSTYHISKGKYVQIPVFHCKLCNTFIRYPDDGKSFQISIQLITHASQKNSSQYDSRIQFFEYLYSLVLKYNKNPGVWVDFGCSYGHFMEFLAPKKIECYGIEISRTVRDYAIGKGLTVCSTVADLPQNMVFDVISFIDSLYYSAEPAKVLRSLYERISEKGLVILRMQNRNWLVKFQKYLLHKITTNTLGDVTIGYSRKSIRLLLESTGYKVASIKNIEKGKVKNLRVMSFYTISTILYFLSLGLIDLVPGFIVIASKSNDRTRRIT